MKSFNVDSSILHLFYTSIVESIIMFNLLTYCSNLNCTQKNQINALQKLPKKVIGNNITSINDHYIKKCVFKKVNNLLKDARHPLHYKYVLIPADAPDTDSFVPNSIVI